MMDDLQVSTRHHSPNTHSRLMGSFIIGAGLGIAYLMTGSSVQDSDSSHCCEIGTVIRGGYHDEPERPQNDAGQPPSSLQENPFHALQKGDDDPSIIDEDQYDRSAPPKSIHRPENIYKIPSAPPVTEMIVPQPIPTKDFIDYVIGLHEVEQRDIQKRPDYTIRKSVRKSFEQTIAGSIRKMRQSGALCGSFSSAYTDTPGDARSGSFTQVLFGLPLDRPGTMVTSGVYSSSTGSGLEILRSTSQQSEPEHDPTARSLMKMYNTMTGAKLPYLIDVSYTNNLSTCLLRGLIPPPGSWA